MRSKKIGLIIVDYLQLAAASTAKRNEGRVNEVSQITRDLKALAKELNVPVLALSQLSRAVEQRDDKRPQLFDLRDSGSIEQDADVVMFVYREQYYLEREEPNQRSNENDDKFARRYQDWEARCAATDGQADVIVAKNRHGAIGSVKVGFEGSFTRFHDGE